MIETSLYRVALRFEGMKEKPGNQDEPFILWALSLCGLGGHDETPWCSAFMNAICYVLGLSRSGSAAARSWLAVGTPVDINAAQVGMDIVITSREGSPTAGHVGAFAGYDGDRIKILGGNQGDMVSVRSFPRSVVLGIRRIQQPKG